MTALTIAMAPHLFLHSKMYPSIFHTQTPTGTGRSSHSTPSKFKRNCSRYCNVIRLSWLTETYGNVSLSQRIQAKGPTRREREMSLPEVVSVSMGDMDAPLLVLHAKFLLSAVPSVKAVKPLHVSQSPASCIAGIRVLD